MKCVREMTEQCSQFHYSQELHRDLGTRGCEEPGAQSEGGPQAAISTLMRPECDLFRALLAQTPPFGGCVTLPKQLQPPPCCLLAQLLWPGEAQAG
jgi:hypothetical protein